MLVKRLITGTQRRYRELPIHPGWNATVIAMREKYGILLFSGAVLPRSTRIREREYVTCHHRDSTLNSEYFMREALVEGRKARGICGDNPPVGCVLVSDGIIVSRGHTGRPGDNHAEAMALAGLSEDLKDISAYVTLEPCSFKGRTPSCARAIARSGIKSVFIGIIDPDPRNNGAGIRILKAAGVIVSVGMLAEEVERDIGPYLAPNT